MYSVEKFRYAHAPGVLNQQYGHAVTHLKKNIEKQAIGAVYSHTLRLGRCNNSKQIARVSNLTPPFIVAWAIGSGWVSPGGA
jgi:hypothetical protein